MISLKEVDSVATKAENGSKKFGMNCNEDVALDDEIVIRFQTEAVVVADEMAAVTKSTELRCPETESKNIEFDDNETKVKVIEELSSVEKELLCYFDSYTSNTSRKVERILSGMKDDSEINTNRPEVASNVPEVIQLEKEVVELETDVVKSEAGPVQVQISAVPLKIEIEDRQSEIDVCSKDGGINQDSSENNQECPVLGGNAIKQDSEAVVSLALTEESANYAEISLSSPVYDKIVTESDQNDIEMGLESRTDDQVVFNAKIDFGNKNYLCQVAGSWSEFDGNKDNFLKGCKW